MRLMRRHKRMVFVFPLAGMDEEVYQFGQGVGICASLYPIGETTDFQITGDLTQEKLLMLYDGDVALDVGMGVALADEAPVWRITALERWDHQRATLERIEAGRRMA